MRPLKRDLILSNEYSPYFFKLSYTLHEIHVLYSRFEAFEDVDEKEYTALLRKLGMEKPTIFSTPMDLIKVGNAMAPEPGVRMIDLTEFNFTPQPSSSFSRKVKSALQPDLKRCSRELMQPKSSAARRIISRQWTEEDWDLLSSVRTPMLEPLFGSLRLVDTFEALLRNGPDNIRTVTVRTTRNVESFREAFSYDGPEKTQEEMTLKDCLRIEMKDFVESFAKFPWSALVEESESFGAFQAIVLRILEIYPAELKKHMFIRFWYYPHYTLVERILFACHAGNLAVLSSLAFTKTLVKGPFFVFVVRLSLRCKLGHDQYRRLFEAMAPQSNEMKRKLGRPPLMDCDLTPREHAIRERYGYDYAIHEHVLEEALRSLPFLKPFWKMFDMKTHEVTIQLPLSVITLDQPFYPGGNYDPYGATSCTQWNIQQLTHVYKQLGTLVDAYVRGMEGTEKVIVPYVDRYSIVIEADKPSIKLIQNTLRVLELPTQLSSSNKQLLLKDVISQEETSLIFELIEAEVYWSQGDHYQSDYYKEQNRRHAERERLRNRIYDDLTMNDTDSPIESSYDTEPNPQSQIDKYLISHVIRRLRILVRCILVVPNGITIYAPCVLDWAPALLSFRALLDVIKDISAVHHKAHSQTYRINRPLFSMYSTLAKHSPSLLSGLYKAVSQSKAEKKRDPEAEETYNDHWRRYAERA